MPYLTPAEAIAIVTILAVAVFALALVWPMDVAPTLTANDDLPPLPTLGSGPAPFDWAADPTIGQP